MTEATENGTGTYLYGIVYADQFKNTKQPLEVTGVGGADAKVRTVEAGDLAAIVSDAALTRYETNRENLVAHETVLEEVMKGADIVPVAFGIVATNDEEVKEQLLQRESEVLHQSLDYVKGRVELTLQVLWNEDRLFREIADENEEIRQLRDAIAGQPADAVHDEMVQLGTLTAQAVEAKSQQEGQAILDALQPLVLETTVNDNITDTMLLNAAFLVEKARMSEVDDKVNQLSQERADRMIFQYVGPLPPFDFVNVHINWQE